MNISQQYYTKTLITTFIFCIFLIIPAITNAAPTCNTVGGVPTNPNDPACYTSTRCSWTKTHDMCITTCTYSKDGFKAVPVGYNCASLSERVNCYDQSGTKYHIWGPWRKYPYYIYKNTCTGAEWCDNLGALPPPGSSDTCYYLVPTTWGTCDPATGRQYATGVVQKSTTGTSCSNEAMSRSCTACGSNNGKTFTNIHDQPYATFCAGGSTVSWQDSVANDGSWNWSCGSARCSATKASVASTPKCGTRARNYAYNVTSYPAGSSWCDPATSVAAGGPYGSYFPTQGGTTTWRCQGKNGGSTITCAATRSSAPVLIPGVCGSSHRTTSSTCPSFGLCGSGSLSWEDSNGLDGICNWSCGGTRCYSNKVSGVRCGTAAGRVFSGGIKPNLGDDLCAEGQASSVDIMTNDGECSRGNHCWYWFCTKEPRTGVWWTTCYASAGFLSPGSCGTANNQSTVAKPTTNLCMSGTLIWNDENATDGTYNWQCTDEYCQAPKITQTCGTAHNQTMVTKPTENLCNNATVSWTDEDATDGTWNWTCGTNNCEANVSPPKCGTCTNIPVTSTGWNGCSFCSPGIVVGSDPEFSTTASWTCKNNGVQEVCNTATYCMQRSCTASNTCQATPKPAASESDCSSTCNSNADCSTGRLIETRP